MVSPIRRTTRKIRSLASAELCATSKYEVVVVVVGSTRFNIQLLLFKVDNYF